jgi:hypothetical protein
MRIKHKGELLMDVIPSSIISGIFRDGCGMKDLDNI